MFMYRSSVEGNVSESPGILPFLIQMSFTGRGMSYVMKKDLGIFSPSYTEQILFPNSMRLYFSLLSMMPSRAMSALHPALSQILSLALEKPVLLLIVKGGVYSDLN